jgi:transposase
LALERVFPGRGKSVWVCKGAGEKAADSFFAELDSELLADPPDPEPSEIQPQPRDAGEREEREEPVGDRAAKLRAISLDMGHGYAKSARRHAPQAVICIDPYHVVQLANQALDDVRRDYFPKGTDLSIHTVDELARIAGEINDRPRKTLDWSRPADLFTASLAAA